MCSEWEIWSIEPAERVWSTKCLDGPQLVHAHLGDGRFENSFAARRDLAADREYDLRVRYRDEDKAEADRWTPWGMRAFRTRPQLAPLANAGTWHVRQDGYRVEEVAGGFQLPVHLAMVPSHWGEWAPEGAAFAVFGWVQLALALALPEYLQRLTSQLVTSVRPSGGQCRAGQRGGVVQLAFAESHPGGQHLGSAGNACRFGQLLGEAELVAGPRPVGRDDRGSDQQQMRPRPACRWCGHGTEAGE